MEIYNLVIKYFRGRSNRTTFSQFFVILIKYFIFIKKEILLLFLFISFVLLGFPPPENSSPVASPRLPAPASTRLKVATAASLPDFLFLGKQIPGRTGRLPPRLPRPRQPAGSSRLHPDPAPTSSSFSFSSSPVRYLRRQKNYSRVASPHLGFLLRRPTGSRSHWPPPSPTSSSLATRFQVAPAASHLVLGNQQRPFAVRGVCSWSLVVCLRQIYPLILQSAVHNRAKMNTKEQLCTRYRFGLPLDEAEAREDIAGRKKALEIALTTGYDVFVFLLKSSMAVYDSSRALCIYPKADATFEITLPSLGGNNIPPCIVGINFLWSSMGEESFRLEAAASFDAWLLEYSGFLGNRLQPRCHLWKDVFKSDRLTFIVAEFLSVQRNLEEADKGKMICSVCNVFKLDFGICCTNCHHWPIFAVLTTIRLIWQRRNC